mmetsp:Transcript_62379/g.101010  ORF Transcript_62379/g.101010 Transcript_62379/m.101010 type:complete len:175 (-) Transcript_62379:418-942(-)
MGISGSRKCCSCTATGTEPDDLGDDLPRSVFDDPLIVQQAIMDSKHARQAKSLATKVETMASEQVASAWAVLENEVNVQKQIWDSMQFRKGKSHEGEVASLSSKIEFAFMSHLKDRGNAIASLEATLERTAKSDLLSDTMMKAASDVMRAEEQLEPLRSCCCVSCRTGRPGQSS